MDSGELDATEPGLGVDFSHFSKMKREFLGVADIFLALGDSPKGLGVEKPPISDRFFMSGL